MKVIAENNKFFKIPGDFGIYSQLAFWRFILGIGIGGEYPLSASITSESSAKADVTRNLAMVFSMQGWGTILCSLVLVTVTNAMGTNYDSQWRIALGCGGIPMAISFYFRWKMHETSWAKESVAIDSVSSYVLTFLKTLDRIGLYHPPLIAYQCGGK